jgi:hypothetical protein
MRIRRIVLLGAAAVWAFTAAWHTLKPLPAGLRVSAPWQALAPTEVRFIADITGADAYGRSIVSHAIFDEMLGTIARAREFIVADFFLFNDHRVGDTGSVFATRPQSRELREALIARKQAVPGMQVLLITDPINDAYGRTPSEHLTALRSVGIDVVVTNLEALRDSNPAYTALWRLGLSWWDDWLDPEWLPHPFDAQGGRVGLHAWARLANFKANHRKVLLADDGQGGLTGILGSANPHDASSSHSNVALRLSGAVLEPLVASELAIAGFSGWKGRIVRAGSVAVPVTRAGTTSNAVLESITDLDAGRVVAARVLTEGAIGEAIVDRLASTSRGDAVDVAMFYLADRRSVEALLAASGRGVAVRLILDPNKDAFGRTKSGVPNRQAAAELVSRSGGAIKVRWYRTHGEQFHTKLLAIRSADRLWLTAGSANLTRRNIRDYNLEANAAVEAALDSELATQVREYFETLWTNRAALGIEYTADFDVYADPSQLRYWQYRFMEATGLGTF